MIAALALGLAGWSPAGAAARAVGVTTVLFTKTSVTTGAPRPLATVVWYPAKPRTGRAEDLGLRDATVRAGRHPLIIFSHGNCGGPREATYLTTALAGQGFIVAAVPHPGNTVDDPSCLVNFYDSAANRVPDVRFVLDAMLAQAAERASPFHRRIRTGRIGMSGLSFGGFTTLLASQLEPRFTASLALVPGGASLLDPRGISIPTLVIGSERDTITPFPLAEEAYALLNGPRYLVELLGGDHLSSVDECGIFCQPGDISQDDAHALILRYSLPFFRRYLRNDRAAGRRLLRQAPGVVLQAEPRRRAP